LGRIGLDKSVHKLEIGKLSGGQKSRVSMVDMFLYGPHFIVLDEPTNHLDMETIDGLIDAINDFNGGLLLVTHNADLITKTECQIYVCNDGTVKKFNGDYDDYCELIIQSEDD
jgi:ATP-binding cassette subfamily F protein 1